MCCLLEGAEVASYVKLLTVSSHVHGLLIRFRYDCGCPPSSGPLLSCWRFDADVEGHRWHREQSLITLVMI